MIKNLFYIVLFTIFFSCSQEKDKDFKSVDIELFGIVSVPKYISEYRIDTVSKSEIVLKFRNNFISYLKKKPNEITIEDCIRLDVSISSFKGEKINSIDEYHQLVFENIKSESSNTSHTQLDISTNLGTSIYLSYYKNKKNENIKALRFMKHFINYSDSTEVIARFDFFTANDSIFNKLVIDAERTINYVDYKNLSKVVSW